MKYLESDVSEVNDDLRKVQHLKDQIRRCDEQLLDLGVDVTT